MTSTFPLAPGQLFTTPVSLVGLPDNQQQPEKMSLLPWQCQVMDFLFASGVQVELDEAIKGDLHR